METQYPPSGAAALSTLFKTGRQIIVDTLCQLGVEVVFGYPGASVMPLFDSLHKQAPSASGFVFGPRQRSSYLCRSEKIQYKKSLR